MSGSSSQRHTTSPNARPPLELKILSELGLGMTEKDMLKLLNNKVRRSSRQLAQSNHKLYNEQVMFANVNELDRLSTAFRNED